VAVPVHAADPLESIGAGLIPGNSGEIGRVLIADIAAAVPFEYGDDRKKTSIVAPVQMRIRHQGAFQVAHVYAPLRGRVLYAGLQARY